LIGIKEMAGSRGHSSFETLPGLTMTEAVFSGRGLTKSALFRWEGNWAVFKVVGGLAKLTKITAGQMNSSDVQVLSGLSAGETVVVHPNDLITDGVRVEIRNNAKE
jgi:hypothetical protein